MVSATSYVPGLKSKRQASAGPFATQSTFLPATRPVMWADQDSTGWFALPVICNESAG